MTERAVVTLSGGQDSTTCLAWAIRQWGVENVDVISFNYGQRHGIELECARRIADHFGIDRPLVLDIPAFRQLGAAALTDDGIDVAVDATGTGNDHAERAGLPSTFVPGRNLIFLGLASAYAAQHGIRSVVTGVCEADRAGYPDCRAEFIFWLERTANSAMGLTAPDDIHIWAPLLHRSKAQTWKLAQELGALDLVIRETHTCYEGDHDTAHAWGYGCGTCPACLERASGYELFAASTTTPFASPLA